MTHVWDMGSIVLERNTSGAVVNRFHRGLGHLISSEHHGFYLFNARGDVVQRVDGNGAVLHTYRFDAFGNQQNQDQANTNPFRFAGEYYDFETSFIYLRARFYNPILGRFISEDPYWTIHNMQRSTPAILQAGNLFVYVMNNPVMWIDPSGLSAEMARRIVAEFGIRGIVIANAVREINNTSRARADAFATERGLFTDTGAPDTGHNIADAYRHFIGNFYMTRQLGVNVAQFVSNMNEFMSLRDSLHNGVSYVLSYNLSEGWVNVMMNRAGLQDIWNDAAAQRLATNPHALQTILQLSYLIMH